MGYTTYDFYKEKYYGDSIGESLFPKWEDRASGKLNQLTYGHINDDTRTEFDERIQKATCALADLLYQIDFKTSHASDEKGGNGRCPGLRTADCFTSVDVSDYRFR